jgi:translocation and assembly module TamA
MLQGFAMVSSRFCADKHRARAPCHLRISLNLVDPMKRMLHRLILILLTLQSCSGFAAALRYDVNGVEGALLTNVENWLGAPPETNEERLNFVVSVNDRVKQSLRAMGYYDPAIDIHVDKSQPEWQLQIDIEPNEPVRLRKVELQVLGEAAEDEAFTDFIRNTNLVAGDVLHHGTYEEEKSAIQRLGQRRGYFDGSMTQSRIAVEPVGATADIELTYLSGERYRYGQLIYDNSQLTEGQLAALLPFKEGEPYDVAQLIYLQTQLHSTGFFSSVIVTPQVGARANGTVPIELEVLPAKRHTIDLGIGYSTDTQERVSITWRTPRINRYGHSQETRALYSPVNPSIRTVYKIPLKHPLNDVLHLSGRLEENEYGDIDSQQEELRIRREIKADNWVYGYSLRHLNESWDVGPVNSTNDYLLPGMTLSHKFRKGPLVDPLAGFSQYYEIEAASEDAGSDVDLIRAYANYVLVVPVTASHRLVARSALGAALIADSDRIQLAPSLNFFAGGTRSVRGYEYQSIGKEEEVLQGDGSSKTFVIGGSRLVTGSLEYQYYVNKTWRGAVFVDAGDAFDDDDIDLHYGAGFGVHYLTAVGAIKMEFARPLGDDDSSWRWHINIGAEF